MDTGPEAETRRGAAAWAPIAGAALLLVAGVMAALALRGGEDEAAAAPAECVAAWNGSEVAVGLGRHQYGEHGYSRAEVTHVDGRGVPSGAGGDCAVIFPSRLLDPEPVAAALVLRRGRWVPVGELPGVTLEDLADLQAGAVQAANAGLTEDGLLDPDQGS